MAIQVEFTFDDKTYRHYINGFEAVMHCHHYLTLTTKLAEEYDEFGGTRILIESVEDSLRPLFDDYVQKNNLPSGGDRLGMAAEFYEVMGMGKMEIQGDADGGQVTLTRSHVDQGWLKKFGQSDHPLNYWTSGYLAAAFACAFDRPARSYEATETASMAGGAQTGQFEIKAK